MRKRELESHLRAAKILGRIMNLTLNLIKTNSKKRILNEQEIREFIQQKFRENNLVSDKDCPIVAFNNNADRPHYVIQEKGAELKENSLILIDMWAKLKTKNSVYADITFMAYKGKQIPKNIQEAFNFAIKARDKAINSIKNKLKQKTIPTGEEIDSIARKIIDSSKFKGKFLHTLGHSLDENVHGKEHGLNARNKEKINLNQPYTIEPGIYLKNKFGIRSELDFYINNKFKMIITSEIQRKIKVL